MDNTQRGHVVTRPSWGRRLVGIEGLRGLAALSVIVGHVQIHLAKDVGLGRVGAVTSQLHHGLTLFFALSGFLLFRPFASAILTARPAPGTRRFLVNRALRIYPAYVVIFLLSSYALQTTYTVAVDDRAGVGGVASTLGPITEPLKVLLNLTLLQSLVPYSLKTGLGAAWSLTAELCFYLALPALAALAVAASRRRVPPVLAAAIVPAVLLVVGWSGKLVAASTISCDTTASCFAQKWGANWHAVLERSILSQADLFAYGAAAAVLFALAESGALHRRAVQALRWGALAVVVLGGLLLVTDRLPGPLRIDRLETSFVAGLCACLVLATALPNGRDKPSLLGRVAELLPLRFSGLISYSLYLWHLPVLWWLQSHDLTFPATRGGLLANVVLVTAVSAALATATYYLVEAPALRLKKRTDTRGTTPVTGPAEATTVALPADVPLDALSAKTDRE